MFSWYSPHHISGGLMASHVYTSGLPTHGQILIYLFSTFFYKFKGDVYNVVAQRRGSGTAQWKECQTAILLFQVRTQFWRPSLAKGTRDYQILRQTYQRCADLGRGGGGRLSQRYRENCSESKRRHPCPKLSISTIGPLGT